MADVTTDTVNDVPEQSPWAEPHREDPKSRVVGWQAGVALTANDVREILKKDRRSRHEYKGLRKATVPGKANEAADPLSGLPPTWQAFWSTVPHLDPQAAYRQFRKEEQRKAKAKGGTKDKTAAQHGEEGEGEDEADVEKQAQTLDEEVRRKKQLLAEKEKLCSEWDKKLARVRVLDRDEGELSRRVFRKLENASYAYGILEGKLRSSDIYSKFVYEDTKKGHVEKIESLNRSCALMGKQIDSLKSEVRMLLKAAAEAQPSSDALQSSEKKHSAGESSEDKKVTGDAASSSSVHSSRQAKITTEGQSSSPSGLPAGPDAGTEMSDFSGPGPDTGTDMGPDTDM